MISKKEDKIQTFVLRLNIPIGRYIFSGQMAATFISKVSVNIL